MIRFFNTYSRALEEFAPRDPPNVSIYTCGPTVYSHAHIGNFRAYIFEDLLQRHLEARGFNVRRVMNITDVDDKTIRGARAAKVSLNDFTDPFKRGFFEDLETLRIKRADEYPGATEPRYLARMIEMISELIKRDLAYQAEDKSVYFRINKFPDYGKLAHLNLEELRPTGRVRNDEYEKENIGDFALWKAWDEADGEVGWDSPWGRGRPGWHIECSAMATSLLGDQIDIHCGGVDNIFPHHEAEIAQSEGVTGKKFVRYWMHCAHLLVDNQKMSKSLGNFYTLRDLLKQGFTPEGIRYLLASVPYRKKLNFTFEGLQAAAHSIDRLRNYELRLKTDKFAEGVNPAMEERTHKAIAAFEEALDDDLNTAEALGAVFEYIRDTNTAMDSGDFLAGNAAGALAFPARFDAVFDVLKPSVKEGGLSDQEVETLIAERTSAKKARNFARADEIRAELSAKGIVIEDTKEGVRWKRA